MSTLDQPLLIANSNYHVGQQTSVRIAEEQGFFRQEGLREWVYEWRGLIPGALERQGLARIMEEHGVDIATAVDLPSILYQRQQGAEVGGPFLARLQLELPHRDLRYSTFLNVSMRRLAA